MSAPHRPLGKDTVSVVIPCFNTERYVAEALKSVLAQIEAEDEIVVLDDGSTDGSDAAIAQFAPRVRYLRQDNQGISAARNAGVRAANRSLIAFLDADDLWTAGCLALRRRALAADPALDYVYGAVEPFISPDVDEATRHQIGPLPAVQPGRVAGTMLIRRRVFDSVGLFDAKFKIGETMDWVARVDAAGHRSMDVGAVILRRRVHGANTVIKQRTMQGDYLRVLRAAIERRRGASGS